MATPKGSDKAAKEAVKKDTPEESGKESAQDTPKKDEEQAEMTRKAAQLGESRKAAFATLVRLAKTSEDARRELAEISKDEYNANYLTEKFGEEYTSLYEETEEDSPALENLSKQVEKLSKTHEQNRKNTLKSIKSQLGLTIDNEPKFDDLVKTFEGTEIAGETVTFEKAVDMAANQMKPGKSYSFRSKGDVIKRPEDAKAKAKVPLSPERIKKHAFYTGAKSAEDFQGIAEQFEKKGSYSIPIYPN